MASRSGSSRESAARFIEVYDLDTGSGTEVGRVTTWEPGRRLGLTWTQVGWPPGASTELEITYEPGEPTRHGRALAAMHAPEERS